MRSARLPWSGESTRRPHSPTTYSTLHQHVRSDDAGVSPGRAPVAVADSRRPNRAVPGWQPATSWCAWMPTPNRPPTASSDVTTVRGHLLPGRFPEQGFPQDGAARRPTHSSHDHGFGHRHSEGGRICLGPTPRSPTLCIPRCTRLGANVSGTPILEGGAAVTAPGPGQTATGDRIHGQTRSGALVLF